ncbi:uncharacterized protein BDW43DRAFT_12977 [Aspergillus alliaceus]|uniref:uncharacterized protein n=1 Tax=Petromyces alliaceus TaxID=209559 RepID=UPI0012A54CDC|nr:uncharacterized protein BDW43DRAFT_12977 [Aspergillus alliaceus]KAB8239830.1 hypothetical protein BDW43DRAFT_12977 [Aspergillus alliaceus]
MVRGGLSFTEIRKVGREYQGGEEVVERFVVEGVEVTVGGLDLGGGEVCVSRYGDGGVSWRLWSGGDWEEGDGLNRGCRGLDLTVSYAVRGRLRWSEVRRREVVELIGKVWEDYARVDSGGIECIRFEEVGDGTNLSPEVKGCGTNYGGVETRGS